MGDRALTVSYPGARRDLQLDLYPAGDGAPVVVWVHGGGWFTGDRTLAPDLRGLLADRGIAAASLDYTLSGEATFPVPLFDVRAAVRFLATEGERWGIDGRRIALWGASAGGHLALLVGLTGGLDALPGEPAAGASPVAAVAAGYPPVDLGRAVTDAVAAGREAATTPESRLLGGLPAELPEVAAQANPLTWVRPGTPGAPGHGLADRLVSPHHARLLHRALRSAAVPSELWLLPGAGHGFLNPSGRGDLAGPPLDEGRLEAGAVPALRVEDDGRECPAPYGYDTAIAFLAAHLSHPFTPDRQRPDLLEENP